jgi:hypothetical protein
MYNKDPYIYFDKNICRVHHAVHHTGIQEHLLKLYTWKGRAMAQAVSRRPPTTEARVRSPVSPCGICGGQSGTGTGFSSSTSVFPCQFHSTGAPLLGKGQKIIIIIINFIFITGLHNKPQGCSASVASAAGPFTIIHLKDQTLTSQNIQIPHSTPWGWHLVLETYVGVFDVHYIYMYICYLLHLLAVRKTVTRCMVYVIQRIGIPVYICKHYMHVKIIFTLAISLCLYRIVW